jgi:hypothetical protein
LEKFAFNGLDTYGAGTGIVTCQKSERNRKFSKVGTGTGKKSYGFTTLNRTDDFRVVFSPTWVIPSACCNQFFFLLSLCRDIRKDISFMHLLVALVDLKKARAHCLHSHLYKYIINFLQKGWRKERCCLISMWGVMMRTCGMIGRLSVIGSEPTSRAGQLLVYPEGRVGLGIPESFSAVS